MSILSYSIRRVLITLPVILGASVITFLAIHFTPASPIEIMLGPYARPEQVERITEELWLNKPFHMRYYRWISNVLQGDFGESLYTMNPVIEDLRRRLPATLELTFVALVIVLAGSVLLGAVSAAYKNRVPDHIGRLVGLAGVATPIFWLALLLQLTFYARFHLLPVGGRVGSVIIADHPLRHWTGFLILDSLLQGNWLVFVSALKHIILPAFALSLRSLALASRMMRSYLLEVLDQDYVRTARAFGSPERIIIFKHALRNAFLPYITVIGLEFGKLLGGTFLIETVFDWPGMGLYGLQSVQTGDFPALLGVVLTVTLGYIMVNLLVDILYALLDPRIRY